MGKKRDRKRGQAWSPVAHLREHHPGWDLGVRKLKGGAEMIIEDARLVLVDEDALMLGGARVTAHALGHVELHQGQMDGAFTEAQEAEADMLAQMWLGRAGGGSR